MAMLQAKPRVDISAVSPLLVAQSIEAMDVPSLDHATKVAYRQGLRVMLAIRKVPVSHVTQAVRLLDRLMLYAPTPGPVSDPDEFGFLKQKEPAA